MSRITAHKSTDCSWLTIEPFITPALFEPFNSAVDGPNFTNNAVDEWHLCQVLGSNMSAVITEHYETFIVRPAAR